MMSRALDDLGMKFTEQLDRKSPGKGRGNLTIPKLLTSRFDLQEKEINFCLVSGTYF